MKLPFGSASALSDSFESAVYYLSGVSQALCFGLVGMMLAALAGAGVAYLTTSPQPHSPDLTNPPA